LEIQRQTVADPESEVRATAALVFSLWHDHLEEIMPAVADMVSDPDPNVRSQADRTLIVCSLGSKTVAKLAVPKLRQLLHHDNEGVRKCTAEVLWLIDPEAPPN